MTPLRKKSPPRGLARVGAKAFDKDPPARGPRRLLVVGIGGRQRRRDQEARRRRARRRAGVHPHEDEGRARPFRRERQTPARRQVEAARVFPGIDEDGAKALRPRGFLRRPQQLFHVAREGEDDAARIDAEAREPAREQGAGVARVRAQRQHDDGAGASRRGGFSREREREAGGRGRTAPVRDAKLEDPARDQRQRRPTRLDRRPRDRREAPDPLFQARERGATRRRHPRPSAAARLPMARAACAHRRIPKKIPDHPGD